MASYLSSMFVPMLILIIIISGIKKGVDVLSEFTCGAKKGITSISNMMFMMIAMCFAVGVMRNSGVIVLITNSIENITNLIQIPHEIVGLVITRPISYAAALGIFLDLLKNYGPDSYIGMLSSILMSCSETLVYTLGIYLGSVNIKKSGYIIIGGILINIIGIYVSIIITNLLFS